MSDTTSRLHMNKAFLLVFHGGLVCYLFLHNFIMPVVKNIGSHDFIFKQIQFYFIPQALLFMAFIRNGLNYRFDKLIAFLVLTNFTLLVFSSGLFMTRLSDGVSSKEFSTAISLASIAVFFLGFFLRFKRFFKWRQKSSHIYYIGGFVMGVLFSLVHDWKVAEKITKESAPSVLPGQGEGKANKDSVYIQLPSRAYAGEVIRIKDGGFDREIVLFPAHKQVVIHNRSHKPHLLRIEYIKNSKWYFKSILRIEADKNINFPHVETGIYQIRSPSSKELGSIYLVIGSEGFSPGKYEIGKGGVVFHAK